MVKLQVHASPNARCSLDLVADRLPLERGPVTGQSNVFVPRAECPFGARDDQLDLACRRRQLGSSGKEERVGDVQRQGPGEGPQR